MSSEGLDAIIINSAENRYYLSGFNAEDTQINESSGALIISGDDLIITTDSRFETQVENEASLYSKVIYKKGLGSVIKAIVTDISAKKIGFEAERLSHFTYNSIVSELEVDMELIPADNIVSELRIVKNQNEINIIKQAILIAEKAFLKTKKDLKEGMTEKEIAWLLEQNLRNGGGESLSFPSIIACGKNSALPHAIPGNKKIRKGEPLLFDWGIKFEGYCSDTSRTLSLGEPGKQFMKVYETVNKAQSLAIEKIKDGAHSMEVDKAARNYINENGFEGKFGHGLGHGVGLEVHELPRLSPIKDNILKEGMIVTVEPGIYLPEWGGVRLENMAVVRDGCAEVLNTLSYEDFVIDL
ncbi:MAG: aminopeptidase P family protein [Desulfobacterales bacterium]|nr:aminopeptidase P family protein [Desulfobacterales bacterium]